MAKAADALDAQLDALYAAPLPGFVGARDALSKSLVASGRKEDAARVKALKKPTPAAWAVNQLAFTAPNVLAALVAAGDRLRAKSPDMKDAMRKRRDALNAARQAAEKAVAAAGHAPSADVVRRVSATLEAIATYGSTRGGPVAGRLAADVTAPGFDEVASLGLLGGVATTARRSVSNPPPPVKAPHVERPEIPSKRNPARERALDEKRRRDEERRAAALKSEARRARALVQAAEKAAEAVRRRKSSLQAALSEILFEEKRVDAALAAAKDASAKADAAERAERTPPT